MYKTLGAIIAVFAATLLLVGLTFSASTDAPPDFSFVNGAEPKTLDPQLLTGQPGGRVVWAIFEGLTRYDAKSLQPAPGMAESWELSPDRKTYTFHLRKGARWTDGHPVTAHDFVYSWRRLLTPSLGSEYAYILYPVLLAEAFNSFEGYATQLEGEFKLALETELKAAVSVPAKRWQALLSKYHVHAALRQSKAKVVASLLNKKEGVATSAELRAFASSVSEAVADLRKSAAEASQRFGKDAGIFAKDAHTLVVQLQAPTPYFLQITSFYPTMPVPRWVVEKPGNAHDWFLPEKIVSNGAFQLQQWRVNERLRLVRNEDYWGRADVRSGVIDALPIEMPTTALNMYLTGATDWLPSMYPMDLVAQLKERDDFYSGPGMVVYYYRLNTEKKPFNDRRVRKAFNLAIDRRVIVEDVLGLGQLPATGMVPPGMVGYDAPKGDLTLDVARARALLAEAGFPKGEGFPDVGILYNTFDMHKKIAEVISDQLRRNLGVNVTAYNQEWQSYQETVRAGDYHIARAGWIGDYNDPNTFLDMWVTNGGNNQTGFSSPTYDRLIAASVNLSSFLADPESLLKNLKEPEKVEALLVPAQSGSGAVRSQAWRELRLHLLREAEAILVQDELPIMPIYFYVNSGLRRPELKGFYSTLELPDGSHGPNLQDIHPLRDLWLDKSGSSRQAETP